MFVRCYQLTAGFKNAGGDPDVVGWDGSADGLEEREYAGVKLPRLACYREH